MFRKITQAQVDAAKTALEQPPVEPKVAGQRTFNLDIAKLLCVSQHIDVISLIYADMLGVTGYNAPH
jgi:hypothetical protein